MQAVEKLVRKQFFISPIQIKKLELLARKGKTSAADMVRKAIDAYDPEKTPDLDESELLELVASRVKEAIADTQNTRKVLAKSLKELGIK